MPNKKIPYLGVVHFFKIGNTWKSRHDSFYKSNSNINFIFNGNKIGENKLRIDTTVEYSPDYPFSQHFSKYPIPEIGKRNVPYSEMTDLLVYRPLLFSNACRIKKNIQQKYRRPNNNDSILLYNYLAKTAQTLQLGNIDTFTKPIIKNLLDVLLINKNCYVIKADINLNMYCYAMEVPFNTDLTFFQESMEMYGVSVNKFTMHASFLVNNGIVSYIDYGLKLLDAADFDNDGFDELIFKTHKYNYSAYLLITNKWTQVLKSEWKYH